MVSSKEHSRKGQQAYREKRKAAGDKWRALWIPKTLFEKIEAQKGRLSITQFILEALKEKTSK